MPETPIKIPGTPAQPLGVTILGTVDPSASAGSQGGSGQSSKKTHRSRASDDTTTARRAQRRHPYADIQRMESMLQDAMSLQTLGDPRGFSPENVAAIESLAKRLEEVNGKAFKMLGRSWLADSLQDYRAKYGDAAEPPPPHLGRRRGRAIRGVDQNGRPAGR